jgi:hypothetical protein
MYFPVFQARQSSVTKPSKRTPEDRSNACAAWLWMAHGRVDVAVRTTDGEPTTLADEEVLSRLLGSIWSGKRLC